MPFAEVVVHLAHHAPSRFVLAVCGLEIVGAVGQAGEVRQGPIGQQAAAALSMRLAGMMLPASGWRE